MFCQSPNLTLSSLPPPPRAVLAITGQPCLILKVTSLTSSLNWPVLRRRSAENVKRKDRVPNVAGLSEWFGNLAASRNWCEQCNRMSDDASDADQTESAGEEEQDPYPLEGKYADEADRQRYVPGLHCLQSGL